MVAAVALVCAWPTPLTHARGLLPPPFNHTPLVQVSWRYPTSFLVWLQALLIGQTPVQVGCCPAC